MGTRRLLTFPCACAGRSNDHAGSTVTLPAGSHTIRITGVNTTTDTTVDPAIVAFAERNIDAVLLTTNTSDINKRIWYAPDFLALDGYLTQQGEVFLQVKNLNTTHNFTLTVPRVYGHSGYFTMHLTQPVPTADGGLASGCTFTGGGSRCTKIFVAPGKISQWVDVGAAVDVYNHGSWNFDTKGLYSIQVGLASGGAQAPTPIGPAFVSTGDGVQVIRNARIENVYEIPVMHGTLCRCSSIGRSAPRSVCGRKAAISSNWPPH